VSHVSNGYPGSDGSFCKQVVTSKPVKQLTQRRALKVKSKTQRNKKIKIGSLGVLCVFALKKHPVVHEDFRVYGRISPHVKQSLLANIKISIYSMANL
jgi:hypothetical protein